MANQCAILKQKGLLGCISECPKGRNYPTKCPETAPAGKSKERRAEMITAQIENRDKGQRVVVLYNDGEPVGNVL